MHSSVVVVVFALTIMAAMAVDVSDQPQPRSPKSSYKSAKDYKVKEKDIKDAKSRWIQYQPWNQQDNEWNEDMVQHPIDEAPRRQNRELGEMCTYSRDCKHGCCLMDRDTKLRTCQRKAYYGEKCSAAQVKGDLYVDACPCLAGSNYCSYPEEICHK